MIASGAITFFFDFDIFSDGPIVDRRVGAFEERLAVALLDFVGRDPVAVRVLIGLVADHALGEQAGEGLVDAETRPSLLHGRG